MMISTKGRYALTVMIYLAGHGDGRFVPLKEIAEKESISEKYLENIISAFSKENYLEGLRGKGGGYRLTRTPAEYSVGEILRLVEGPLAPVSCLEQSPNPCEKAGTCRTLPMWAKLGDMINRYLDGISLAEFADVMSSGASDADGADDADDGEEEN